MTPAIVLAFPGQQPLADSLARHLDASRGSVSLHAFPDGETLARIEGDVEGHSVVLACTLDRPDAKLLPVAFAADAARELGARRVGLAAPYLGYLRQDRRFHDGEAVTSRTFASLLGSRLDFLVTVDPHLHRYRSLAEIYSVPAAVVHAAPAIAGWISQNVAAPVLIGPDAESEQWVADVARRAGAPYQVLQKTRTGDREVDVSLPDPDGLRGRTPVLVDDIVSTARTLIQALRHLGHTGLGAAVCVGVHAVFAQNAYEELLAAGAGTVATCNTIAHTSNAIDLDGAVSNALRDLL